MIDEMNQPDKVDEILASGLSMFLDFHIRLTDEMATDKDATTELYGEVIAAIMEIARNKKSIRLTANASYRMPEGVDIPLEV
jgi:hypothetical protein